MILFLPLICFGLVATAGLSGCADIGLEVHPQTYTIAVTEISGELRHSMNVTFTTQNVIPVK